ncbi:hypothetical protein [Phaeobacter italicus]|jgi:hypothetical protein|uniref:hypothetical protein n=1 Tax=Phaeobacter italicus TaxID=481446 RepID=UPI002FDD35B0
MPNFSTIERFVVGDLVAFHFPFSDRGSKTRICAIVAHDPNGNEVVVAYGTSNLRLKNDPDNSIALFQRNDWKTAGLHEATRFQVDRRVRVKLGDPRFKQHQSLGTAKVGQLSVSQARRLREIYDRLPLVTRHQEMNGIHPKPANKNRRPSFLGRGNAGRRPAASAI